MRPVKQSQTNEFIGIARYGRASSTSITDREKVYDNHINTEISHEVKKDQKKNQEYIGLSINEDIQKINDKAYKASINNASEINKNAVVYKIASNIIYSKIYLNSGGKNNLDLIVLKGIKIPIKNKPLVLLKSINLNSGNKGIECSKPCNMFIRNKEYNFIDNRNRNIYNNFSSWKNESLLIENEKKYDFDNEYIKIDGKILNIHKGSLSLIWKKCNTSTQSNKKDFIDGKNRNICNKVSSKHELRFIENKRKFDYGNEFIQIVGKIINIHSGSLSTIWKNEERNHNYPIPSLCCDEDDPDILELENMITCLENYHNSLKEKRQSIKGNTLDFKKKTYEKSSINSFCVDNENKNHQDILNNSGLSFIIPLDLNQFRKRSKIFRLEKQPTIEYNNKINFDADEIEKVDYTEKLTYYKKIKNLNLDKRNKNNGEDDEPFDIPHILESITSVAYNIQNNSQSQEVTSRKIPEIMPEPKNNLQDHFSSSFNTNEINFISTKAKFQGVQLNKNLNQNSTDDSFVTARESSSLYSTASSPLSQMLSTPIPQEQNEDLLSLKSFCNDDFSTDSYFSATSDSFTMHSGLNNVQIIMHTPVSGKSSTILDALSVNPLLTHMSAMTGLLILTQPIKKILPRIPQILSAACEHVSKTLYIHLDPLAVSSYTAPQVPLYDKVLTQIYARTSQHCQGLDVRVLMTGFKHQSEIPLKTLIPIELVLFDMSQSANDLNRLEQRYKSFLHDNNHIFLHSPQEPNSPDNQNIEEPSEISLSSENTIYSDVVVGGTFDRIHEGHKILLSQGLLRCSNRLTSGVSEGPLLKNKTLKELILPIDQRIAGLKAFLMDVDPTLEYNLVPITDSLGPTRWDPKMEMIVVSEETKKGVDIINAERIKGGLKSLQGHVINLVEDLCRNNEDEEAKVSSSSGRMRLLGTSLKPPVLKDNLPDTPYIIGLTGGTGSGKSSVAKRFEGLGTGVVDCDKLGHEAYVQGTVCYNKLVKSFGECIIAEDGSINRRALGSIVFGNKEKLDLLNSIVWPEIAWLAQEKIKVLVSEGKEIIILDAAVLLEAKWDSFCHQVWVCFIKRDEAVGRIVARDGKSIEDAERRIDNQMSNEQRIAQANLVFCTQWSYDYTQLQVEKAWKTLKSFSKDSKSQL